MLNNIKKGAFHLRCTNFTGMKTSIVWFKTDLRLRDNETLVRAIESSDQVVPVYCLDDALFAQTAFGFRKTGHFRAQFLLSSLQDLDEQLRALGSGLLVLRGKPEQELPLIAQRFGARQVFAKKEVAHEELEQQARVEQALWKVHCSYEVFSSSTLYLATDFPFSIKDIPDVFTTFRKKIEKEDTQIRGALAAPTHLSSPPLPACELPTLSELGLEQPLPDPRNTFPFAGGETAALERLNYYFDQTQLVSHYKDTRNQLLGTDYSSKFSPWLAQGCLSPRYIFAQLKNYEAQHGSNDSTYWLVFELLWRDFFRFMMKKHHNQFFKKFGITGQTGKTKHHDPEKLQSWINGTTGLDFVDACMRELKFTGYLSNRGRQNVASYLCHDLHLDWRYGAAYFEQQLIDYDVCSNWGNWAYLAGVGNDPRKHRYFNCEKQASQYDPDGMYRKTWLNDPTAIQIQRHSERDVKRESDCQRHGQV